MAKATAKSTTKKVSKAPAKAAKKTESPEALIEKTCVTILSKLQALGIDQPLQSDIEWCLGSYRHDQNPNGLYQMAERALNVFQVESAKKTKGVTAKLITDIEKALKTR